MSLGIEVAIVCGCGAGIYPRSLRDIWWDDWGLLITEKLELGCKRLKTGTLFKPVLWLLWYEIVVLLVVLVWLLQSCEAVQDTWELAVASDEVFTASHFSGGQRGGFSSRTLGSVSLYEGVWLSIGGRFTNVCSLYESTCCFRWVMWSTLSVV